jgi:hypothetical protein
MTAGASLRTMDYLNIAILVLVALLLYAPYNLTISSFDGATFSYLVRDGGYPYGGLYKFYMALPKAMHELTGDTLITYRILSYVPAIMNLVLVYLIAMHLLRNRTQAFLSSIILATMPLFWFYAISTEAYQLGLAFCLAATLVMLRGHWLACWLLWSLGFATSKLALLFAPLIIILSSGILKRGLLPTLRELTSYKLMAMNTLVFAICATILQFTLYHGTETQYFIMPLSTIFSSWIILRFAKAFAPMGFVAFGLVLPLILYGRLAARQKSAGLLLLIVPVVSIVLFAGAHLADSYMNLFFTYPFLAMALALSAALFRTRRAMLLALLLVALSNILFAFTLPMGVGDKMLGKEFHYSSLARQLGTDFPGTVFFANKEYAYLRVYAHGSIEAYTLSADDAPVIRTALEQGLTVLFSSDALEWADKEWFEQSIAGVYEIELVKRYDLEPWYLWAPKYINVYLISLNQPGNRESRYDNYPLLGLSVSLAKDTQGAVRPGRIISSVKTNLMEGSRVYQFSDVDGIVFLE